jgi:hypothetical protein
MARVSTSSADRFRRQDTTAFFFTCEPGHHNRSALWENARSSCGTFPYAREDTSAPCLGTARNFALVREVCGSILFL